MADEPRSVNPAAMSVADAAEVLTAAGRSPITAEQIEADIRAGCPVNEDGSLNLICYAAWQIRDLANGGTEPQQPAPV